MRQETHSFLVRVSSFCLKKVAGGVRDDMKRIHFISLLAPALVFANKESESYERQLIQGWTVVVNRRLLNEDQTTASAALKLLETKLKEINESVPPPAVQKLKKVRIWLEHPSTGVSKCAAYHPSERWLSDHGHKPAMARCVEFGNPKLFIAWSGVQPSMVLHELAHAYHHQVLTHQYQPISDAYQHAMDNDLYTKVKYINDPTKRAYALNNKKEFFAELTEAYFGKNDFFPFVYGELKSYDPKGFSAIEAAWQVPVPDSTSLTAT